MTWELFEQNLVAVLALMTALWLVSVWKHDVSIVDPWWSMAFLLVTVQTIFVTGMTPGKRLLLGMVALWAYRLWLHLLIRGRGQPEDPRYASFRQRFGAERYWWVSLFQVFTLQGLLAAVISLPLQFGAAAVRPDDLQWNDWVGAGLFLIGFLFEAIADTQLQTFRNDPANRGRVMDSGLWRYSRHPNYFGETLLWWGFWLCAVDASHGWTTFPAPVLMTFLLLRVSGVTLLDNHLRKTKPAYADYIARTSTFIPRRPRASVAGRLQPGGRPD